jgi:hypothetical protein
MATTADKSAPAEGLIDTKADEAPNVQNPPTTPEGTGLKRSASGEYRVLTGVLTLADDADGKKVRMVKRGQKIKPGAHVDVDRLLALRAIEPFGTRAESVGPSNAFHLAKAANAAADENEAEFLDDGQPVDVVNEGANA